MRRSWGAGSQSTATSSDAPRANVSLGVRHEPREGVRAPDEAKRLGEAPEELLGLERPAIPERGPCLVVRQRREDIQQRAARAGGQPPRLGDGRNEVDGAPGDRARYGERLGRAARRRVHEPVRRSPEGVLRPAGDEADRAAIGEAHPGFAELAPRRTIEHDRDPTLRIELQHAMPERRRRIGSIERDRPPGEDTPDREPVRDDHVIRPHGARECRAERVAVVAVEAFRGAAIERGHERPGIGPCGRGRVVVRHRGRIRRVRCGIVRAQAPHEAGISWLPSLTSARVA